MRLRNLLVLTGTLVATAAAATPLPRSGQFVFSDACASPGGDFEGLRVRLTRNAKGARAIVEFSDDGSDGRATPSDLVFNPASGALSFSFRGSDGDRYAFHGIASREKLDGRLETSVAGGTRQERTESLPALRKVPRYLPPCDPRFPP
jgi:hypothetical protein